MYAVAGGTAPLLLGYVYNATGSYTRILSLFSVIVACVAFAMLALPAYRYSASSAGSLESLPIIRRQQLKTLEQEPMYLREVEANPQPSPYASLIDVTRAAGREYWQIWHLFAFRPEVTSHLASFTEEVMRAPSSVSLGLRELIAA